MREQDEASVGRTLAEFFSPIMRFLSAHPREERNALGALPSCLRPLVAEPHWSGFGLGSCFSAGMRMRIVILEEFEWLEAMAQSDLENSATTIKLDQFLKWSGLVQTGGEAKMLIQSGEVRVNGAQETRRGRKLMAGDRVSVYGDTLTVDLSASASPGFPCA